MYLYARHVFVNVTIFGHKRPKAEAYNDSKNISFVCKDRDKYTIVYFLSFHACMLAMIFLEQGKKKNANANANVEDMLMMDGTLQQRSFVLWV